MNATFSNQGWRLVSGVLGLTAVAAGAIGAHAFADAQAAASVERASMYQLIHAAVLFFSVLLTGKTIAFARWIILAGLFLFCGSIYVKYFLHIPSATQLAPVGGTLLVLGWLFFSISGLFGVKKHE